MKNTTLALSLIALSAPALAGSNTSGTVKWHADFDEAVAAAKAADKDLFVDFTGSDWCGWCTRLEKEVFEHQSWGDVASKEYVFVALDFPQGAEAKAAVPNPERNDELKDKYGITGFPTILLMTTDGTAYARTGYVAGGPTNYLAHMADIAGKGKKAMVEVDRVAKAFTDAEGDEAKWKAWDELATVFADLGAGSPFVSKLADHVRWALEADPENEKGKKLVAMRGLLTNGAADEAIVADAIEMDSENEEGLYELAAQFRFGRVRDDVSAKAALEILDAINELGFKDSELAFSLNFSAARWCAGPLADKERSKGYAQVALEIGSEDETATKMLRTYVD